MLVGTSVQMAGTIWLAHPKFGYERTSQQLRALVESDGELPRRLHRASLEEEDAHHRIPAPSLTGANWNVGEIQLVVNAEARTRSQKDDRMRHNMDLHYAERYEPDSLGIRLVAELGEALREMGLPSVAYIKPENCEFLPEGAGTGHP